MIGDIDMSRRDRLIATRKEFDETSQKFIELCDRIQDVYFPYDIVVDNHLASLKDAVVEIGIYLNEKEA